MKIRKPVIRVRLSLAALLVSVFVSIVLTVLFFCPPILTKSLESAAFIHVHKSSILNTKGEPFLFKGIAFGNEVWNNPPEAPDKHHTEEDYKRIHDLGFNSVRFYLNYRIFEEDSAPYKYKESGFEWIAKNVEWAKKNDIYLILNMHVPQGGFQSNAETDKLWKDEMLQKRFFALWKQIARRFADEPTIAGYSILNEPGVHGGIDKWASFAQETVRTIREVDKNHIIIVERMQCNIISPGNVDWNGDVNGNMNFVLMDDPNIMYEFHFYEPFPLTHQGADWLPELQNVKFTYPGKFKDWDGKKKMADKAFIEQRIEQFVAFGRKHGVPLYLGEFGAIAGSFESKRNGAGWVSDVIDICMDKGINFNYHTYHETNFGLYRNEAYKLPSNRNEALAKVFAEKLKGKL